MTRFKLGKRVLVKAVECSHGDLFWASPRPGTVARLRRADTGAWVALDQRDIDNNAHPFPADDRRATHVLTYPDYCEPEKGGAS